MTKVFRKTLLVRRRSIPNPSGPASAPLIEVPVSISEEEDIYYSLSISTPLPGKKGSGCSACGKIDNMTGERKKKAGSFTKPKGRLHLQRSHSLQPSILMECGISESDLALSQSQNIVTITVDMDKGTVKFVK